MFDHRIKNGVVRNGRIGKAQFFSRRFRYPQGAARGQSGSGKKALQLRTCPTGLLVLDDDRLAGDRANDLEHIARRAAAGIVVDDNAHDWFLSRWRLA